jgi:ABC-2 type transport system permease protein
MRKVLLVVRQELFTTFRRRSYLLFAFGIPIVAVLIVAGVRLAQGGGDNDNGVTASHPDVFHIEREGFVDQSGLIQVIPQNIAVDHLVAYQGEEQAKQALRAGEITAYYVIPADYIEKGKFFYVYPDTRSYLSDGQEWVMSWTLMVNLLSGREDLADKVWSPMWQLQETSIASGSQAGAALEEDCSRPGVACQSNDLIRYLPFITMALLYVALLVSSSMLFNSIGSEKENRTIELLMLSINSRQLLAGKTIALGVAGLTQTAVWLGAIFIAIIIGGSTLSLPENFTFPIGIIAWSLVFFFGGYGVYASLMAGAGALVPKMKEAGFLASLRSHVYWLFCRAGCTAGQGNQRGFASCPQHLSADRSGRHGDAYDR